MSNISEHKGTMLILLTALVSGASIFMNKFAVAGINPFVLTTAKNLVVAVFLLSVILLLGEFKNLKALTKIQWSKLALIGLIGGSIPFLLFFYALSQTSAINAGFLHKTLFLWASLFALIFLKEKISQKFAVGALLLLAGNFILFSNFSEFGFADLLILLATLLWAAENIISKHALAELSGKTVAFGRMFFGSLFMLAFLAFTNNLPSLTTFTFDQSLWVLTTASFLFLYVFSYYSGLKHVSVSKATALLLLAQPITALLSFLFIGSAISASQAFAFTLFLIGSALIVGSSFFTNLFPSKSISQR